MNRESLEEFYSNLLEIEWPWEVKEILRDGKMREVSVHVEYDTSEDTKCPTCGKTGSIHDRKTRKWRHLDSCNHKTIIESKIPRVKCPEHGVLQIKVPWAEKNSRFTLELERHVCRWLKAASIKYVADIFRLSWDEVAGILGRAVRRGLKKREKIATRNIGIDETSYQKRHEYVTVILDKESNTVLDVLEDRKAETLGTWLKTQETADLTQLSSISMDMWDPFIKAVKENIDGSDELVAFDRYHVAQHFNKAVDKVRAQEHREMIREYGESRLTGTKYEWLRTSAKTDNRTGDRPAFLRLSRLNMRTARAWRMKETASILWNFEYLGVAEKRWKELLRWIARSRLAPMIKVGRMIKSYFWGIMNAIRLKTSNAMLEAVNAGIQRIKRMACGFRNRNRFRMAILFHFGGLDLGF